MRIGSSDVDVFIKVSECAVWVVEDCQSGRVIFESTGYVKERQAF